MEPMSQMISPELLAVYRASLYQIEMPTGIITLRVDELTPESLFETVATGERLVFVSACNPRSKTLTEVENLDRHELLKLSVQKAGYKVYHGVGCDPSGQWPSEISLAVFDATDDDIDGWMLRFEQNAVVIAERGSIVKLRLHPGARMAFLGDARPRLRSWRRSGQILAGTIYLF